MAGLYYFGDIQPGRYELTVEAEGFKKWVGTLALEVGQTAVVDPVLEVGSLTATVEVTAATPVITLEGMQVADVKDEASDPPIAAQWQVRQQSIQPDAGRGRRRSAAYEWDEGRSTEMLLDGLSIVDRFGGGIQRVQPGLDTVQEFRIETTGSSARYARPATVMLATKSGTNELHGSVFETFRTNAAGTKGPAAPGWQQRRQADPQ